MDVVVLVASLLLRLAAAGAECAPEAALDRRRGAACRWRRYDSAGVVDCLDVMARAGGLPLHFLFVGDSRMRQQFFSFLRLVPDYDLNWSEFAASEWRLHRDVDVESRLLDARFSFRWRPLYDASLVDEFERQLAGHHQPVLLLLGASLHHMLDAIGENEIWFEQQLRLLAPLLWRLVDRAGVGVVWRAGDAVGVYAERDATTSDFTVDKIRRYDNIARRVFRHSGVLVWDSGQPAVDEYVRGCQVHWQRRDVAKHRDCRDAVHAGYVALHDTSQPLWNYLCRRQLSRPRNGTRVR